MGIPGLYRWLVERYPNTLCRVADNGPRTDTTKHNPNGVEFDNLYIDINGVIHPCFHPEGLPAPQSYEDVFPSIFRYIDRVFSIVRPRKLLFLAVDGVAPRAKMNHQRIRRFRAATEAADKISAEEVKGFGKSESDKKLDSNVITPGTEFMALLAHALKYYVHMRMNEDPGWKNIKVILSDSSVGGEGEHKIMSYIRTQRNLPGYDPNTRHCLHGLDADLIMLALATHEIHFSILREVTRIRHNANIYRMPTYIGSMRQFLRHLKFEFFNIWVLREYLERELLPNVKGTDFERLVDDFVFICLFVGNDFLPKLPSLDIAEGGIELLLIVYQEEFVKMGYLTDSSKVNLKCMEHFLQALSSHENAIFMKRRKDEPIIVELERITAPNPDDVDSTNEEVKVHEKYTKQSYYTERFDCRSDDFDRIKRDVVLKYTEGVCWVMHYYYQGVCSWQWFYPYHYAPLASDFCSLDKLEVHFTLGQPFKPLDQLLGVLPAASAQALPLFYRELMTKESSPILDFYPEDVKIEKNGKKRAWQWVCKLPFIEEPRLLSETVKLEHTLTDEEKQRNRVGRNTLFVHHKHPLAEKINNHHLSDPSLELQIKIKPELSGGMNGYLCISDKPVCVEKITSPVNCKLILKNQSVKSVDYKYPSFQAHIPKLPCGIIMPPRILRREDCPHPPVLWHATPVPSERPIESLGMVPEQHGSKDGVRENCINNEKVRDDSINGKLGVVEGRESSPNMIEPSKQREFMVGNDSDEKWMVVGKEKVVDVSRGGDSGLESNMEHESMGGEPKRKKKKKRVKGDKLEAEGKDKAGIIFEAFEKPKNKVKGEVALVEGDEPEHCKSVEVNRKKHSKRRRVKGEVEGKDKTDQKPPSKMESGLLFGKEQEIIGGQVGLVEGGSENNMESSLSSVVDREIEIGLVEGTGEEVKRKKQKRRKKTERSENGNDVEVSEKRKMKVESEIVESREKQKKRKCVKGEEKEKEESDLPFSMEQGENEAKRKKHKRKEEEEEEEEEEVKERRLESDLEQQTDGEPKHKKHKKRRQLKEALDLVEDLPCHG